jgi:hypothetical protein
VTFAIISGPATIVGNTLTLNGTPGTVVVRASKAGNSSYAPGETERSIIVQKPKLPQTIDWTPPAIASITQPTSIAHFGSANGSSNLVVFTVISGPGVIDGPLLICTASGDVVITATQAGDADFEDATPVTRTIRAGTTLELWRHQYFNNYANTGPGANEADPNQNGISNLLEYALGGNPVDGSTSQTILPQLTIQPNGTAAYTFTRRPERDDVLIYLRISGDLQNWSTIASSGFGEPFNIVPIPGFHVTETGTGATREVTFTGATASRRFLTLAVFEL